MEKHRFNIFPEMSGEEFEQLKADLAVNEFDTSQPIVIYENAILDGWNRFRACQELDIAYTERMFFGTPTEAINFVARTNNRRHLNESQRAMLAVKIKELAFPYIHQNNGVPMGTLAAAAEAVNVSERSAKRASIVTKRGVPELAERVEQGNLAVRTASEIAQLPKTDQTEILDKIRDIPRKDIKETIQQHLADKDEPMDTPKNDDFTNLAKHYGNGFLIRLREVKEFLEKAEQAFLQRGKDFKDFGGDIAFLELDDALKTAVKLRNVEKCGFCLAKGCDQCVSGYLIKENNNE